ncbi:MAG TPA: hypothetical protein VFX68_06705 [Sulfuricurvum sp.]|nr:hypothetical protein [Sulfuricurvum sp.]
MNRTYLSLALISVIALTSGCANREGVAPSQNTSLNAVSPSGTATSEGGAMQRSLDGWLKEEWTPMTAPKVTTTTAPDGTTIQTKTDATEIVTTTTAPDGKVLTTTTAAVVAPEDETPFTLQKYADKWKVYHENKAKMNEGKPQEVSNVQKLESLPVIGK